MGFKNIKISALFVAAFMVSKVCLAGADLAGAETDLRLATYNLWTGLDSKGLINLGSIEPREARDKRESLHGELLADLSKNTDLIFFQEVNPYNRFNALSSKLGLYQSLARNNCGVKIGGQGLPLNLNMGLATLASKSFWDGQLENWSVDLSGPGFISKWFCFHLKSKRTALLTEFSRDGVIFLAVNVHLHHQTGYSKSFEKELIQKLENSKEAAAIIFELKKSTQRRKQELNRLARAITFKVQKIKQEGKSFGGLILGGDFNIDFLSSDESSDYYKLLKPFMKQLKLSSLSKASESRFQTWNQAHNLNETYSRKFHHGFEHVAKSKVANDLLLKAMQSGKMLDEILISSDLIKKAKVSFAPISDKKHPKLGRQLSDHFGVRYHIKFK